MCVCVAINGMTVLKATPPAGLKKMLYSFAHSVKRLSSVLLLTAFMLCIFATVGLHSFMGNLRQKCTSNSFLNQNLTSDIYSTSSYGNESTGFNYWEYVNNPGTMLGDDKALIYERHQKTPGSSALGLRWP